MHDLLIRNARLVSDRSITETGICISGGKISALIPPGDAPPAREVYDAAGRYVLPGLVDAHVHFRDPGPTYKEGFENGSLAAARGGVTTVIIMPTDDPMTDSCDRFREKVALGRRSHVDFGLNLILGRQAADIGRLAACGPCAFELFFADLPEEFLLDDPSMMLSALRAVAGAGAVAGITPTLASVVGPLQAKLIREGRKGPLDFAASRPPSSEAIGVALACEAAILTGCRVHIRQVTCREAVETLRSYRERARGLISAETLPHNLLLAEDDLGRLGPIAKMAPPLRPPGHGRALASALRDGTIDIVVTDHAPHLLEEKEAGCDDIWKAASGIPGLETLLPVMLRKSLDGAFGLSRLVDMLSTRPARLFGLFPRKGCIAPGADADLIVVDASARRPIALEGMRTRARYTPFLGMEGAGSIDLVLLRGRRIAVEGEPAGDPTGRLVTPCR